MITRRTLLALGAVSSATPLAAGLSACSVDSLDRLRPAARKPKVDPDALLLDGVRTSLQQARALAVGTPFAALPTAQLAALGGPSSSPRPTPSPTSAPAAPATPATADQVRASETALQRRLLGACERAHSGRFAMVFASMAAGIGQALA